VVTERAGVVIERAGVVTERAGVVIERAGVVIERAGVVIERADEGDQQRAEQIVQRKGRPDSGPTAIQRKVEP